MHQAALFNFSTGHKEEISCINTFMQLFHHFGKKPRAGGKIRKTPLYASKAQEQLE